VLEQARAFREGGASIGTWLAEGLRIAFVIATAVLQLVAGVHMARGQSARRYVAAYVIVALVGSAGLQLCGIAYWLLDRDELHIRYVLGTLVIDLAVAVARPMLVWQFAKHEGEPGPRVDAALPWAALWFAPQLAARCLLGEDVNALLGALAWPLVALCAVQAIACVVAARATLRDEHAVVAWRVAAGIAAVLLALVVYWMFWPPESDEGSLLGGYNTRRIFGLSQVVGSVGLLFATMATGAWLANRARSS
jgi:hypothetical protein